MNFSLGKSGTQWLSACTREKREQYYCVWNSRVAALLCRAERYIRNFYLKGLNWGALKAGKRYIGGALYPGKTYIARMGFAQGT